jgi:hypothetical protein
LTWIKELRVQKPQYPHGGAAIAPAGLRADRFKRLKEFSHEYVLQSV